MNPYETPQSHDPFGEHKQHPESGEPRGLVGHVRAIAILAWVQGALELAMGGGLLAMAFFMPVAMREQMRNAPQPPDPQMDQMMQYMTIGYGVVGVAVLLIGLLRIVAGIFNFMYRGRVFGIVANLLGLATLFTCYCGPTSVGLAIYSMVVFFNREVTMAFRMRGEGASIETIDRTFSQPTRY